MTRYLLLSAMCFSLALGELSFAQETTTPSKQAFEEAFGQMMKQPDNLDLTLRYAELAIAREDYEAAIPALERILMFNPKLSKIRLELGTLYYRLRAFDMAKAYLLGVLEEKNVDDAIRKQAQDYLKRIDKEV